MRFRELRRRLAALRANMLPATFSPTGSYSERQLDRARGYRLLAHAEIESFLEDVTMQVAKAAVLNWISKKKTSDSLICLLAHYHVGFDMEGEDLEPSFPDTSRQKVKEEIKEAIQNAFKQYNTIHDNNHGIREKNFKRLVLPIGIRIDQIDPTWLTNMDDFGKVRGEIAHKTVKIQQQIDPKSEFDRISDLVSGLKDLDKLILSL